MKFDDITDDKLFTFFSDNNDEVLIIQTLKLQKNEIHSITLGNQFCKEKHSVLDPMSKTGLTSYNPRFYERQSLHKIKNHHNLESILKDPIEVDMNVNEFQDQVRLYDFNVLNL